MLTQYAFLILRTDDGVADDRRVMTRGSYVPPAEQTSKEFADELLRENRIAHNYYTGPRRCSIWPVEDDEPIPWVAPEHALHVDG